jgi:FkbM family methyltransferase
MVDRESVFWTYRLILGREPESEQVIQAFCALPDRAALVRAALSSPEFASKNPTAAARSGRDVWVEIAEEVLLKVNLADELGVSGPVIHGAFEPAETQFVKRAAKAGHTCADVGANLGYFTILMASLVQDTGKILSFEPNPNIFPYLLASTKLNGFLDRVTLHNLALSDAPGGAMLLFAAVTNNWGGSALNLKAENLQDHVNVEVRLETLNFIAGGLTRLDFIKIDVEGAEFLAMKGGADVLRRFKPTILSEIHVPQLRRVSDVSGEEYIALMQEFGYACFELLDGGAISTQAIGRPTRELANVVFLHPERASSL